MKHVGWFEAADSATQVGCVDLLTFPTTNPRR